MVPVSPSAVSPHTYKDQYRQHVQNAQRILVVEDHDDLREYLSHTLSEAYQVETCTNGKEALKIIPEFNIIGHYDARNAGGRIVFCYQE